MTSATFMTDDLQYVGFWQRVGASVIDNLLLFVITIPLVVWAYGWGYFTTESPGFVRGPADVMITWVLPALLIILCWWQRQATPGKVVIGARIVDAKTGGVPTPTQLVLRYIGYFVSCIPHFAGIFWIAISPRKQGWHDLMAGTVVVRSRSAR